MKRGVLFAGVFLLSCVIAHLIFLDMQPRFSTAHTVGIMEERGRQWNVLSVSRVRKADKNFVVRDNPDTITAFAVMNLDEGPLAFTMPAPQLPLYWSVAIYAENTDVLHITNDKGGVECVRLTIAPKGAPALPGFEMVTAPSDVTVLIVRATMPDRNDELEVNALREELLAAKLVPAASNNKDSLGGCS